MSPESIVDRLAALPVFAAVPRTELEWLVERGELRCVDAGAPVTDTITPTEVMIILLSGRLTLYAQRGNASRKFGDSGAGQVLGILPYSRFQRVPGTVMVEENVAAFLVHRSHFPALIRECPALTTALVHHMLDRANNFRATQFNDERLESLSRLASGLAHELNNPASAAARTAHSLVGLLAEEERAARELAAAGLSDDQFAAIDSIRSECGRIARPRTALEAADREDDLAEWLTSHGVESGAGEALAASDLSMSALDRLAGALPAPALGMVIRWVASGCAARAASRQIEVAAGRIHDLVRAVKGFTFMDRNAVPESIDVARGVADTLAMLENKARAKSATVHFEQTPDLPRVNGVGSEINQVWEKLVDNALDAVGTQGTVTITASARGDSVLVRIADDGPGIAEEIRARIYDPFFTTKPVGQGTGLGLDTARRIVHLHGGDIDFSTQPGHTVFRVRLPAAGHT